MDVDRPENYLHIRSKEEFEKLFQGHCSLDAQCASTHEAGDNCKCGTTQALACCTEPPNPPMCEAPNKAALAFLNSLCRTVDRSTPEKSYGGGLCNGGFNWAIQGEYDKMYQINIGTPTQSVNCAVDPDTRTCKYNVRANADSNGDIIYANLGWDLDNACLAMKKDECTLVQDTYQLCKWEGGECIGWPGHPGPEANTGLLPLCLKSAVTLECGDSPAGTFCFLPGTELLGRCNTDGNCAASKM